MATWRATLNGSLIMRAPIIKEYSTLPLNVSSVNLITGRWVQAAQFMTNSLAQEVVFPLVTPSRWLRSRLCSICFPSLQIILYILWNASAISHSEDINVQRGLNVSLGLVLARVGHVLIRPAPPN